MNPYLLDATAWRFEDVQCRRVSVSMANFGMVNLPLVVTLPLAPACTAPGNGTPKGSPTRTGIAAPYRCRVKVPLILFVANLYAILLVRACDTSVRS